MRLYEITDSNKNWSILGGNTRLQEILASYIRISHLFDRLLQGIKFPNNTEIWNEEFEKFKNAYDIAINFLESFPDQNDQFVGNLIGKFGSHNRQVNEMTSKLKQLKII
jgi:hypothetical protein